MWICVRLGALCGRLEQYEGQIFTKIYQKYTKEIKESGSIIGNGIFDNECSSILFGYPITITHAAHSHQLKAFAFGIRSVPFSISDRNHFSRRTNISDIQFFSNSTRSEGEKKTAWRHITSIFDFRCGNHIHRGPTHIFYTHGRSESGSPHSDICACCIAG